MWPCLRVSTDLPIGAVGIGGPSEVTLEFDDDASVDRQIESSPSPLDHRVDRTFAFDLQLGRPFAQEAVQRVVVIRL